MQKRQIEMQDGRSLIFYTFEDEPHARVEEKTAELRERITPVAWGGEK